jgi:heme/copper-type cytochrome/quinol oxidase subunit 1
MAAEWLTAIGTVVLATGTIVLAVVAIFQDTVRGWFYYPALEVSIQTQPPDCIAVPITT